MDSLLLFWRTFGKEFGNGEALVDGYTLQRVGIVEHLSQGDYNRETWMEIAIVSQIHCLLVLLDGATAVGGAADRSICFWVSAPAMGAA